MYSGMFKRTGRYFINVNVRNRNLLYIARVINKLLTVLHVRLCVRVFLRNLELYNIILAL